MDRSLFDKKHQRLSNIESEMFSISKELNDWYQEFFIVCLQYNNFIAYLNEHGGIDDIVKCDFSEFLDVDFLDSVQKVQELQQRICNIPYEIEKFKKFSDMNSKANRCLKNLKELTK